MRKNKQQKTVRKSTAGNVERSMLGKVYLWVSERKNSKYAQRPHKTYQRRQHKSIFRVVAECIQTAPTACWRRLKDLISFSNKYGRRLAKSMRNNKRNGD
jgi:hypothetical protein